MQQKIPGWIAAIIIVAVIALISAIFFLAQHKKPTASPEEIEQKKQIYKMYRMKGLMKATPSPQVAPQ